ncbi:VOC family protein [Knoellia sp. CPCC 206450]|uniref:VOC family protein n=1 Tax=Knoellia tibetensis TaxID=3404798 RepID=UPI003B438ED3
MATSRFRGISIECSEPVLVGRFWAGVLGWELDEQASDEVVALPHDGTDYRLTLRRADTPKRDPNRIHFDLTSRSEADMTATVDRALALGGRHIDIGQTADDGHVVLADPEGNELCVIEPGNSFLADTGVIGGINCDGSHALGVFWSEVLGWPLVWDQDEETAIQSPTGGSKITWSGPPLMPRLSRDRLHLELSVPSSGDLGPEVRRLVALGAIEQTEANRTDGASVLVDPDGNEFRVLVG